MQSINLFFAEADLGGVPAEIIKWVMVILLSLLGAAGIVVAIISVFRKQKMTIEPQPVEVRKSPKRYNYELNEDRHTNTIKQLDNHEERIAALEEMAYGMEARILKAGQERETRLQEEFNKLPDRIIATLANTRKIND